MNAEFHYWVTLYLARKAGVERPQALLMARSAQFVDERTDTLRVHLDGRSFDVPATQRLGPPDPDTAASVWLPFHFIPGDSESAGKLRLDGARHPWAVTPNSPAAKRLLILALKSGDPFRIGIALHSYADTWAHQNFVGTDDRYNSFSSRDTLPSIGHAAALSQPDRLNQEWEDPRLVAYERRIDNRQRFIAAARMLYKYLATFTRKGYEDVDFVTADLEELWGERGSKGRAERYTDYAILLEESPYDPAWWYVEAGLPEKLGGSGSADPEGSYSSSSLSQLAAKAVDRGKRAVKQFLGAQPIELEGSAGRFLGSALTAWSMAAEAHRRAARDLLAL